MLEQEWWKFVHQRCKRTAFFYARQARGLSEVLDSSYVLTWNGARPPSGYQIACPHCGVIIEGQEFVSPDFHKVESLKDLIELARAQSQQARWTTEASADSTHRDRSTSDPNTAD